jgi:6-phosphogluconolactonase (cycloisomerase 2 family)
LIARKTLVFLSVLAATPVTAEAARDAYVADLPAGGVAQLAVDPGGALAPLVPASLPAEKPRRLTMTPDGLSLYVTAGDWGHGRVLQYDVAPDGLASPKDPPAIAAGRLPFAVATHPSGDALYVADKGGNAILQFGIGPGGKLEAREPLSMHGPLAGVAVAPDGRSVYVLVGHVVKKFAVGDRGEIDPDSLVAVSTSARLTDLTLTPDGEHLYASSLWGGIFQFDVGGDGALTPLTPSVAPVAQGTHLSAIAVAPNGESVYASGHSHYPFEGHLSQFSVAPDGTLVAKDPPSLVVPGKPLGDLSLTPNGQTLYAAGGDLHLFDVNPSGLATPKISPIFDLRWATGVVVSPNQAPVASFDFALAPAGSVVSFDASDAADPDGSITRYDWDFGDGNLLPDGGPNPSHLYTDPGRYEVRLVVTDNEGASTRTVFNGTSVVENGAPSAATVRVIEIAAAALPPAPPVAPPQPPATPTQARPELGETIIVEPAGGTVRVRVPGASSFLPLEELRVIPVGSLVDARRGKALLSSVRDRRGAIQQGHFSKGLFKVRQRRSQRYVTELTLRGELGPCPNAPGVQARSSRAKRRKLWGNGNGRYRTQGRYSSSAVRGTRWLTQDTCEGTLTVVRRGRVVVRDFVRDTRTVVRAGERYLAEAP